ncbi:hypothetical protein M422DRAFT_180952 [Sphaerobolus stellatus SS14]|uniref:glutathione transferase n=1 Tax=Sphaerobolus stellatus (strain SS14) TaxID=990650 RepID=A0A0C9VD01_SPHS4|nr:hypothetical protein M422DRAFT_180952 [Sphaerobolus stellatus SS14]
MADPTPIEPISAGIVVHHLNNSRSQRILWLLEELEVPYEIRKFQRTEQQRAPEELKKVHPLGKAPIITDGTVTLAESGAIVEYLITKYGGEKFTPPEAGKIDNLYFSHYAEGTLMPILVNKLIFTIIPQKAPSLVRPLLKPVFGNLIKKLLNPELKANAELVELHFQQNKSGWIAGGEGPTSADFMMGFPLEALSSRNSENIGPKTKEYVERIHERPAFKRALEKGGKYAYA